MTNLTQRGCPSHARVEAALVALKQGKGIIVVDDEARENEGDLIFAAQTLTDSQMAQLIRDCSGIVCLCLTEEKVAKLGLPMMVTNNKSRFQTAFTVSIEARFGVSTGVSAQDRVRTIQAAINPSALAEDLVYPGHVFPLVARQGGVLTRAGHTESSVDLVKLAGLGEAAVLCELTNPDGTMMIGEKLTDYATTHQLPVLSVEDVIAFRQAQEDSLKVMA